jgi:hypothetical protein
MLTKICVESEEMHNMKVIDNFDTFPVRISTPSYDQWFRSYDHCKLGVLLEINSRQIKLSGQFCNLRPLPKEI